VRATVRPSFGRHVWPRVRAPINDGRVGPCWVHEVNRGESHDGAVRDLGLAGPFVETCATRVKILRGESETGICRRGAVQRFVELVFIAERAIRSCGRFRGPRGWGRGERSQATGFSRVIQFPGVVRRGNRNLVFAIAFRRVHVLFRPSVWPQVLQWLTSSTGKKPMVAPYSGPCWRSWAGRRRSIAFMPGAEEFDELDRHLRRGGFRTTRTPLSVRGGSGRDLAGQIRNR